MSRKRDRAKKKDDSPKSGSATAPRLALRVPPWLLLGVALLGVTLAATQPIGDNDYGFHLRLGSQIAQSGPPATDSHSYTAPGAAYPDQEWLSQLLWFLVHRAVGDPGMVVFQALLIGLAMTLVTVSARPGGPTIQLLALNIAFLLSLNHIQMRPHLLSWVFAATLSLLLQRRLYGLTLALLVLWANCHASVPLGAGLSVIHLAEEYFRTKGRKYLALAAACFAAPLLNPYGIRLYTLFFEIRGNADFIGEWKPYDPSSAPFWLVVVLFSLCAIGLARTPKRSPFDIARVASLAVLAFSASRHGVVAAICLAPLLGKWFGSMGEERVKRPVAPLPNQASFGSVALAAVPVIVFAVLLSSGNALAFHLEREHLPIESLEFVKRHRLEAPLFNDYNFGGWLLWKGWPEYPVFVDGRVEVYKGDVLDRYRRVSQGIGYRETFDRYGIKTVLIRPERELARLLLKDPDWGLVYFDYNSVVFARTGSAPRARRLDVVSPWGHRDQTRRDVALSEITYLLDENPYFFGGHKIRAFLLARAGDFGGARDALRRYLALYPEGRRVEDTKELMERLAAAGVPL